MQCRALGHCLQEVWGHVGAVSRARVHWGSGKEESGWVLNGNKGNGVPTEAGVAWRMVWHKMMGRTEQNEVDVMTRNRVNGRERLIKSGRE